jgi:hypothetical protein
MPDQPHTEITTDEPLFLAPMGRPGDPINQDGDRLGYFTKPGLGMRHEPECVGPAIVHGYAQVADFHRAQQHAANVLAMQQTRPLLKAEDRLKDAMRRAKQAHRKDLSGEFLALKHMLAHDLKGGGSAGASTLQRLERVEARLDGLKEAA